MSRGRSLYVFIGRQVSPLALMGLRLYEVVTHRPRVRVLVTNEHSEVLLIKGVISSHGWWTLPGGGVNRHEATRAAAKRELAEETGIEKPLEDFAYLRTIPKAELNLGFRAPLFQVNVQKNELPRTLSNPTEIAEIGWFLPDVLPRDSAPLVETALTTYRAQKTR